jgi:hypothetical protein
LAFLHPARFKFGLNFGGRIDDRGHESNGKNRLKQWGCRLRHRDDITSARTRTQWTRMESNRRVADEKRETKVEAEIKVIKLTFPHHSDEQKASQRTKKIKDKKHFGQSSARGGPICQSTR